MGGRNRLEALAGLALGVVGLLLVGYLTLRSWLPQPAAGLPATTGAVGLWDAYEQAHAAARAEAGDAQLVSASTQWRGGGEQALLAGASGWAFVFYSPAGGQALDVALDGGEAWVVDRVRLWSAPALLGEGEWRAGPQEVLRVFLAYGGAGFLERHPGAVVDLHLAQGEIEGADGPAWSVAAVDPGDRSALALVVDGRTEHVLSVRSDEGG